jgi:hypothetical protein
MNSYLSIRELQLREAVERAIAVTSERVWPFFIAIRYRRLEDVDCFFDSAFPAPLREFMESCAKYSFPAYDRGELFGKANYESISDPGIRNTVERPNDVANDLGHWYFCAYVIPSEVGALSSIFEYGGGGNIPHDVGEHLMLCFQVAYVASGGPNFPNGVRV